MKQTKHIRNIYRKAGLMIAALIVLGVGSLLISFIQHDYIIPWMQIGMLSISGYLLFNM